MFAAGYVCQKVPRGWLKSNIGTGVSFYGPITWLRFTGPDNGHTLFATAHATGETVRVSIGWKIDWDAAVPMMEALKLK